LDPEPVATAHDIARFGDDVDLVELSIIPSLPFGGRDREHLEWPAEVEYFDVLEDQDTNLGATRLRG
jgi:hypothetical protein